MCSLYEATILAPATELVLTSVVAREVFKTTGAFVPSTRIKKLPRGISASEAMKYVVSGGVTTVDDSDERCCLKGSLTPCFSAGI